VGWYTLPFSVGELELFFQLPFLTFQVFVCSITPVLFPQPRPVAGPPRFPSSSFCAASSPHVTKVLSSGEFSCGHFYSTIKAFFFLENKDLLFPPILPLHIFFSGLGRFFPRRSRPLSGRFDFLLPPRSPSPGSGPAYWLVILALFFSPLTLFVR